MREGAREDCGGACACLPECVCARTPVTTIKRPNSVSGAGMQIGSEADAAAGEPVNLPVQASSGPATRAVSGLPRHARMARPSQHTALFELEKGLCFTIRLWLSG